VCLIALALSLGVTIALALRDAALKLRDTLLASSQFVLEVFLLEFGPLRTAQLLRPVFKYLAQISGLFRARAARLRDKVVEAVCS
jgi:hypothetical protein